MVKRAPGFALLAAAAKPSEPYLGEPVECDIEVRPIGLCLRPWSAALRVG